jgi:hypothetical protein
MATATATATIATDGQVALVNEIWDLAEVVHKVFTPQELRTLITRNHELLSEYELRKVLLHLKKVHRGKNDHAKEECEVHS